MFGLVLLAAVCVGYLGYSQWQFGQLSNALEGDIATLHRLRWERPVLRTPELDGNAADAIYAALEGAEPLPPKVRNSIAEQLHFGQPLTPEQRKPIEKWNETIGKLRDATHHGWSATPMQIGLARGMPVPDYPLLLDAALVSLGSASIARGDGCLTIAADTIRYGQDLVTGAPMEASSVSARIASIASRVAGYCVADASPQGLRRAAAEFRILATQAPPTGSGIEVADLLAAMEVRRLSALTNDDGFATLAERLRKRTRLYSEWKFLGRPSKWRKIAPESYPGALDDWRGEHDLRVRSDHETVRRATVGVLDWLYDDMRGQALTRAMAVGLATVAERARRGRMPRQPLGIRDAGLRDPFSGADLGFRIAQDGGELTLWSVGEDMRDDRGTDEWGTEAPLDVVVHLRLPAIQDERSKSKARKRRSRRKR